jgi:hypothetical protein
MIAHRAEHAWLRVTYNAVHDPKKQKMWARDIKPVT